MSGWIGMAYRSGDKHVQEMNADRRRARFLEEIELESLTAWDQGFVKRFRERTKAPEGPGGPAPVVFTPEERKLIDRMREKIANSG